MLVVGLSDKGHTFFGSADRVVNYKLAYEPPAPFAFRVTNESLSVFDNESLTLEVVTIGESQPKDVRIVVDGNEHVMKKDNGRYLYTLPAPVRASSFYLLSDQVRSRVYSLTVLKTPAMNDFGLYLRYPAYLNKKAEFINGTGNATIPEGTRVSWKVSAANTDLVEMIALDTVLSFQRKNQNFSLDKFIYTRFPYEIAVSNANAKRFEQLGYQINVIKDEAPTLAVTEIKDSLNHNIYYYSGEAGDDYGLKHIGLVAYPVHNPKQTQSISIDNSESNFQKFYYTFPSGLVLEPNLEYEFYFTATDNDGLRGGKTVKSRAFNISLLEDNELRNEELKTQETLIRSLDNSLEFSQKQKETLKEINASNKEKSELNYNDQSQVKEYLERQQQQEQQMEKFSKQLNENLEKLDQDSPMSKMLQERLERQELEAKKNQKLLEELNKIADKIKKDELTKRLDELSKSQQNNERNLAQLLELMKRFYVEEKSEQLSLEFKNLSVKQNELSESGTSVDSLRNKQEKLNRAFNKLSSDLEELLNDNKGLQKPLSIDVGKEESEIVKEEMKEALESIDNQDDKDSNDRNNSAVKKQKSAAKKMQEISEALSQSAASGGGSSDTEDAEMLRQILDNLLTFSFKQESLYDSLEDIDGESAQFSSTIKEQQRLKELFEHVDDSIFSLSLRRLSYRSLLMSKLPRCIIT